MSFHVYADHSVETTDPSGESSTEWWIDNTDGALMIEVTNLDDDTVDTYIPKEDIPFLHANQD